MNKNDYLPIKIPSNLKYQANIPNWSFKILFKTISNILFIKNINLEKKIINKIKKIHNIKFENYKFFNSGRSSLLFILKEFSLKKNDIVIIPSFTCRSVLHSILQLKLKPLLVDIDNDYNIDLKKIINYKKINKVKAIVIPNMFGVINKNINDLYDLKKKYGFKIIEDNALSFGSRYKSNTISDAIFYSFNIGKLINSAGGGLILYNNNTKDKNLISNIKKENISKSFLIFLKFLIILKFRKYLRYFLFIRKRKKIISNDIYFSSLDSKIYNNSESIFFNFSYISKLSLSLLDAQIANIEEQFKHNIRIKKLYNDLFNHNKNNNNAVSNFFILKTGQFNRFNLGSYLSSNGVEAYWSYLPLNKISIYKKLETLDSLDNTNEMWNSFLYLPINHTINERDVLNIFNIYKNYNENNIKDNKYIFDKIHTDKNLEHKFKNRYDKEFINYKVNLIKDYIKDNSTVLDLCCGSGEFYNYIKDLKIQYFGVDYSNSMLRSFLYKNSKYKNFKLIKSNAENLKIETNTIDLCFCYSSIYYIKDIEKVLFEIKRVLKKDGIAIIEFATKKNINSFISEYWHINGNWGKPFFLKYNSMINIINKNNFKILNESHFQFLPIFRGPLKYIFFSNSLLKKIIHLKIYKKSIDQIISSNKIFKKYSFKHFYILQKQ